MSDISCNTVMSERLGKHHRFLLCIVKNGTSSYMNAYSVSPETLSNRSQESEMMSCILKCLHFTKVDEVVRFFTKYNRL